MTDEKCGPYISQPIKEYVDGEIKNLKEIVYLELDARAKALDLAHQNKLSNQESRNAYFGILAVVLSAIVSAIVSGLIAHFWK